MKMLSHIKFNPDVLSCLSNLSNEEVFTSPELANEILDLLPQELFSDKETTFLNPATKSGVILREITKRLMEGLKDEIPDRQERVNHIFSKQLYGIAITELTSLLSRRSLYCSKIANGKYSVCDEFETKQGNIVFNNIHHEWKNGNCRFCGASKKILDRPSVLESHAYEFIHRHDTKEIFNIDFDVIISNPPWMMLDGGGTGSSSKPIYHKFIDQAIKVNPKYLVMIIQSKWYTGGKGLDSFRKEMLNDKRIRKLVDFADSRDVFFGPDIPGGVCYFLWDRENPGPCEVVENRNKTKRKSVRTLNEFENIFIREKSSIDIINKIKSKHTKFLDGIVSSRKPFGLESKVRPKKDGDLNVVSAKGDGKISSQQITNGKDLIDKWKVLLSKASTDHGGQAGKDGKRKIFAKIDVMPPGTVCTESYLCIGPFNNRQEAVNMVQFLHTIFCRFLVSVVLLSQNITRGNFIFVPELDMYEAWTDEDLYKKFDLSKNEIEYIESLIRPMEIVRDE